MSIITDVRSYEHGFYCRKGNRIHLSGDLPLPAGINPKLDSKKIEPNAWSDFTGKKKDGVSYEVEGWSNE